MKDFFRQLRVEGQLGIDITVLADKVQRNDLTALNGTTVPNEASAPTSDRRLATSR